MEDFSIREIFWAKYNPFTWSRKTIIVALVAFYVLFGVAFLAIGLSPVEAKSSALDFDAKMSIPAINLDIGVVDVDILDGKLETPDELVGRYSKNPSSVFLFGHSTGAFSGLFELEIGEKIEYEGKEYVVKNTTILAKTEVNMNKILAYSEVERLVLMTCAGEEKDGGYTERLIVEAEITE